MIYEHNKTISLSIGAGSSALKRKAKDKFRERFVEFLRITTSRVAAH